MSKNQRKIKMKENKNRITRVSIEGFRSLKAVKDLSLSDLNVLIGPNGSGKSNFIGFFQMLNFAMTESLQEFIQTRGFGNSMLFMGSKPTPTMRGSLEIEGDKGKNGYEFTMAHAAPDTLIYTHEIISFHPRDRAKSFRKHLDVGGKESAVMNASRGKMHMPQTKAAQFIRGILSKKRVYQFHDTSLSSYIRKASDLRNGRYLYADAGNLSAVLHNLKSNSERHYVRIVQTLRRVIPGFKDFVLEPEAHDPNKILLRWRGPDPTYEFGPHQISDGSLRFMALVTLLMQPPDQLPDMIIIDEPELGLHPAAEALVAGLIRSASKHCQVVVATQSATFLDSFEPEHVIVSEIRDGATSLARLSSGELEEWLTDYTLGDVWRKNLIGGRP